MLRNLFQVKASNYWDNHYRFGKESIKREKRLTNGFIDVLIINAVAPLLFLYGQSINNQIYKDRAIMHLENIKAEKNSIISNFGNLNLDVKTAADSQALIQLKKNYCDKKRCMSCSIGNKIIHD